MKQKFFPILILLLAVLLVVTACDAGKTPNPSGSSEVTTDAPTDPAGTSGQMPDGTTEDPSAGSTEPTETDDPYAEEREAAKNAFLDLMENGFRGSPSALFEPFLGDYVVDSFTPQDECPTRMWKKGDVTAMEYADGTAEYYVLHDGQYVIIDLADDALTPYYVYDAEGEIPSIFGEFGFDVSSFYSPDGEDASGLDLPDLSADLISVNGDGTVCTVDDSFMQAFIRNLCAGLDYTEDETAIFLGTAEYSASYVTAERTFTMTLKGNIDRLGDVDMAVIVSDTEESGPVLRLGMDVTVTMEGIPVTVETEFVFRDLRYNGEELVGATMMQTVRSGTDFSIGGVTGKQEMTEATVYVFDCAKKGEEEVKVTHVRTSLSSFGANEERESYEDALNIKLDATGVLTYMSAYDGVGTSKLTAEIVMESPADVSTEELVNLAKDAILNPDKYFDEDETLG